MNLYSYLNNTTLLEYNLEDDFEDYEYDDEYMFILNNMYQIMNMFIKSMIMIIHLE